MAAILKPLKGSIPLPNTEESCEQIIQNHFSMQKAMDVLKLVGCSPGNILFVWYFPTIIGITALKRDIII